MSSPCKKSADSCNLHKLLAMTHVRPKNAKIDQHGRPLLASNAALSWFTERATMDDRYSRWTAHGSGSFLEALTRRHRYFAIGFPHASNNTSDGMWSTFSEGHGSHRWKGTTDGAMEEGFQPLDLQVYSARDTRTAPVPKGSCRASTKASSVSARVCGEGAVEGASNASTSDRHSRLSGLPDLPRSDDSKASSECTYVRRLVLLGLTTWKFGEMSACVKIQEALRRVQPKPHVSGPVRKLDWDMFAVTAQRDFEFEATGKRAIHPTVIPGAKPLANDRKKKKKEE
ncbi:unnamed protein product [Cladocopium goreaui]|uniref:Uncharacterized protein n=1 Tax=Cladocopium goreaui TaxID=2562237 RepID=A0A9P1DJM9_9DINO|nr:unnamed protein product [Cladocopium goreaui]